MTLRTRKFGGHWKLEDIKDGLEHFYNKHGKYPTATEIDSFLYLPSSRTIQRSFGGLVSLRENIKLSGQSDFRSGEHSRKRSVMIAKRAHVAEDKVYTYLKESFGREFVRREYFFTDDKRTRADFFVYDADKGFCVDVFYPNSRQNLIGCLNSKLNKYLDKHTHQYPIIYLQMNEEIDQGVLDDVIKNKKRKLPAGQYLMAWDNFREFCGKKKALRIR